MYAYKIGKDLAVEASPIAFINKSGLEEIVLNNLNALFFTQAIAAKYSFYSPEIYNKHQIDLIGIIDEVNVPVILQFKESKNDDAISKCIYFWKVMQKINPSDFFGELPNKVDTELVKAVSENWHKMQVICVGELFSEYDLSTAALAPFELQLVKFRNYENNFFTLEPLALTEKVTH